MRDQLFKVLTLRFRYGIDLFVRVDPAKREHHRKQFRREQTVDHVAELFVPVFLKFTQDPRIQLFFRECRLQVQISFQRLLFQCFSDVGARRKPQRAGNSEMCKQHLAESIEQRFFAVFNRHRHIFQGESLQLTDVRFLCFQRHQRRAERSDGKSCLFCETVAVSIRPRRLVRHTAGCDNDIIVKKLFPVFQADSFHAVSFEKKLFYFCILMHLHIFPFQFRLQRADNIRGVI